MLLKKNANTDKITIIQLIIIYSNRLIFIRCFQATMQVRRFALICGVLGMINYGFGCQLSEFMCDTGYCVALDKFCNGNDDCGDKSDEPPYCSRKSFPLLYKITTVIRYYTLYALCSRETTNETFSLGVELEFSAIAWVQNISMGYSKTKFVWGAS